METVAPRRVLIDWDWAATGIWSASPPGKRLARDARRTPDAPPRDRHRAWRGLLTDDLIDALQAWNDRGEEVMGSRAHQHTDEQRAEFWARGRELAIQAQRQLGPEYEVICRGPKAV